MGWTPGWLFVVLCLAPHFASADTDSSKLPPTGLGQLTLLEKQDRPQNPKPPFPYTSENVAFTSFGPSDVMLAGTLTIPKTPGPYPAVLLISGAGPSDRDYTLFGHSWFLVLADHLTRNGIAVLRYDDRGVGESTGDQPSATAFDLADDALGGIRYLKTRQDIDSESVGVLGHSEGTFLSAIAVSKLKDAGMNWLFPDFVVMAAPQAITFEEINLLQIEHISKAAGLSAEEVQANLKGTKKVYELIKRAQNVSDVAEDVSKIFFGLGEPFARALDFAFSFPVEAQIGFFLQPYMKVYLTLDPVPFFKQVDLPTLGVLGRNDGQDPIELTEPPFRAAFAGKPNVTITVVDGANHFLQIADTKLLRKMQNVKTTIEPAVLDIFTEFILEQVGLSK